MSSKGNERRAAMIEREARRPKTISALARFALVAAAVAAVVFWVAGCALEPPEPAAMMPTRTIIKTVATRIEVRTQVCPTDSQ